MKNSIVQLGHHIVITLKEPINHQNCKELEATVLGEIEKSRLAIVMECKEVGYLDSAALEMLLRLHNAVAERGSMLKLVELNELCRDIMIVSRLVNQLYVYTSVQEAMKEPS